MTRESASTDDRFQPLPPVAQWGSADVFARVFEHAVRNEYRRDFFAKSGEPYPFFLAPDGLRPCNFEGDRSVADGVEMGRNTPALLSASPLESR